MLSSEELGPSPRPRPLLPELVLTHRSPNSPHSAENPRARSEGPRHAPSSCRYPGQHMSAACPQPFPPSAGTRGGQGDKRLFSPVLCPHPGTSALTLRSFPVT